MWCTNNPYIFSDHPNMRLQCFEIIFVQTASEVGSVSHIGAKGLPAVFLADRSNSPGSE